MIKNLNPALGPGETKLRSKYIGPFRIIKVYPSSLVVVPWTENARLEEYYKDPDLFRYVHRGDIRPFHSRQVAVKDCKPYRAAVRLWHHNSLFLFVTFLTFSVAKIIENK